MGIGPLSGPGRASSTPPPPPPTPPVRTGNPFISSATVIVGDTATAGHGAYSGTVSGYTGQWYRGTSAIALATGLTYQYQTADLGFSITYQELASNSAGFSAVGTSNALGPITAGSLTNTVAPTWSGKVQREGQATWLGAGTWNLLPNLYRFKTYRNGVLATAFTPQAGDAIEINLVTADVGVAISATVEASADNGLTWSAPVQCRMNFAFPSTLVMPVTIGAPTLTRTSASGTLPMTFAIGGVDLYDAYILHLTVKDSGGTTKYDGYLGLTEGALTTPYNVDLSGNTDPAPSPAMPALLGTDTLTVQIVSPDYYGDTEGVVSGSATISPTDSAGTRYWTFQLDSVQGGSWGGVMAEIETAITVDGTDNATGRSYSYVPSGAYNAPGSFGSDNFFNGNLADQGAFSNGSAPPYKIVIDYGANVDLHQLRLTSKSDFYNVAFNAFQFGPSNSGGTFSGTPPVVVTSSAVWSSTVNETRKWSF